jgi:hypothetical protein
MYIYYIDGKKFTTDDFHDIPIDDISSPDNQIPGYEDLLRNIKIWLEKGEIKHRLIGPAIIVTNKKEIYYINDKKYENVKEWIKDHPNPDLYFNANGIFTEIGKVLWFLKN